LNIYITRNGQNYGPYAEDVVRKYIAEGSMLPTDLSRTESMSEWIPLGQLLMKEAAPQPAAAPPPQPVPSQAPSSSGTSGSDFQPAGTAAVDYFVARGGQTYGPYSDDTVRRYIAEGSILASDMGRSEAMPNWVPLSQLLGAPQTPAAALPVAYTAPAYTAPAYQPPAYVVPAYSAQPQYGAPALSVGQAVTGANVPPNLHWALILVIAMFTSGLFVTVWGFVQANWIKKIDSSSKAFRDLAIGVCFPILGIVVLIIMVAIGGVAGGLDHLTAAVIGSMVTAFLIFSALCVVGMVFTIKAFFSMKGSMETYYNTTEPIHLRLSGAMTLFFNVFYLQYHMSRIADWKVSGVLRP
jgi:hypothetical protein